MDVDGLCKTYSRETSQVNVEVAPSPQVTHVPVSHGNWFYEDPGSVTSSPGEQTTGAEDEVVGASCDHTVLPAPALLLQTQAPSGQDALRSSQVQSAP